MILERLESLDLLAVALLPGPSSALSAATQLALVQHPASNPALPAGMDVFNPPVSNFAPSPAAPQLATLTNQANPNDSLAATGFQFSTLIGPSAGQDTVFQAYGQTTAKNADLTTAAIQELQGNQAVVTLNAGLPTNSMYLVWAENAAGASLPFAVNKTQAWWIGPNAASPGATVSVYGDNLSNGAATPQSWIYLQPAQGQGQWITPTAVNPYKVDFVVPSSLAAGSYQVWVHNGHGGIYGWSSPVTLTVQAPANYGHLVVKLASFPGGLPNTGVDATPAFLAAIAAIGGNGPATIQLQAGTYYVSNEIDVIGGGYTGLLLQGAGKNATIIKARPGFSAQYFMKFNPGSAVSDLTVDTTGASLSLGQAISGPSCMTNVSVIAHGYNDVTWLGQNNITVKNCDFVGTGIFMTTCTQVFVMGCNFYATDGTVALVAVWSCTGVSVTNCTAQDYNVNSTSPADHGMGRFFWGMGIWGTESDVYIGDNRTIQFAQPATSGDQNSGEQIMWEGNQSTESAMATSAASNTVTLGALNGDYVGREAVVVSGKGTGEHRTIVATDFATGGRTLTLDSPWDVVPDATSQIDIITTVERVVVYHNTLQGNSNYQGAGPAGQAGSASSGIEPFTGGFDFVIDKNTLSLLRWGINTFAAGSGSSALPFYAAIVENNIISNCTYGIHSIDLGAPAGEKATFLGNIYRDNTMTAITAVGWDVTGYEPSTFGTATMDLVIFEHNHVSDAPMAIQIGGADSGGPVDLVVREDVFDRGAAPVGSQPIAGQTGFVELLQDNQFNNYLTLQNAAGTLISLMPTFSWNAIPGASHYLVWVQDLTTGQSPVLQNSNVTTNTWTATTALTANHSYRWWVEALGPDGPASNWSSSQDFFIAPLAASGGTIPVNSMVFANSASLTPTLSWSPVSGADSYDVDINDTTTGQSQVVRRTTIGTSLTVSAPLVLGHQYVWWVRALNNSGNSGPWSGTSTFSINFGIPVGGGAAGFLPHAFPTFSWNPIAGANFYDVWVNDTTTGQVQALRSPLTGSQVVTGTTWSPPVELHHGHTYIWWVRAMANNGATGTYSSGVTFSVASLNAVTLISPVTVAYHIQLGFHWNPVIDATYYYIWVSDVTSGTSAVFSNSHVPTNAAASPLQLTVGHTYRWWVQAFSANGDASVWSTSLDFTAI